MVLSYNLPGNRTPPLLRDRALLTMLLSHLGLSICLRIGNGIPSHPMVVLMMKITIGSHFLVMIMFMIIPCKASSKQP